MRKVPHALFRLEWVYGVCNKFRGIDWRRFEFKKCRWWKFGVLTTNEVLRGEAINGGGEERGASPPVSDEAAEVGNGANSAFVRILDPLSGGWPKYNQGRPVVGSQVWGKVRRRRCIPGVGDRLPEPVNRHSAVVTPLRGPLGDVVAPSVESLNSY